MFALGPGRNTSLPTLRGASKPITPILVDLYHGCNPPKSHITEQHPTRSTPASFLPGPAPTLKPAFLITSIRDVCMSYVSRSHRGHSPSARYRHDHCGMSAGPNGCSLVKSGHAMRFMSLAHGRTSSILQSESVRQH